MATIIEVDENTFIAGDPPAEPPVGQHWCTWCGGDGLENDWDDALTICGGCSGACTEKCFGCDEHPFIGPTRRPE
ncbi:uncharacterized protein MalAC0309_1591 [Microcella alkaliphila]|uniref:Uncharacterized protein n=1 Tax=Microcella alkaliphila TaxID=279828 RepID=A0A0U4WXC1_9MICO|nr:uncharacterized protein MalAC0309_1591 [Microcella alkaliphila]